MDTSPKVRNCPGNRAERLSVIGFVLLLPLVAAALCPPSVFAGDLPYWRRIIENRLEKIRSGEVRAPILRRRQAGSLQYAHYRSDRVVAPPLPGNDETDEWRRARAGQVSDAILYLDELYGERDDLEALAVRDSDGDGVPDYRVSDYFGKFMEGDVDLDGDGIRNVVDSHPEDPGRGGRDTDADGIPDLAGSFTDKNADGVPDHLELSGGDADPEFGELQRRLLLTNKIALVERNAEFDLELLQAVDDATGKVFRAWFERSPVMPTLRTIAVEETALLGKLLSAVAEDNTSAQVFSQTQSLTVYDDGRDIPHKIGLLGLLVHEIGHCYHMTLDFEADEPVKENGRTRFPQSAFIRMVEPLGWTRDGYYEGEFAPVRPATPRFAYTGVSEPLFRFRGRSPEDWLEWLNAEYEALGRPPDYLEREPFSSNNIVSDYSLTSPYEWYGDNLLAYVALELEREAMDMLSEQGRGAEVAAAKRRIAGALREIWPGFFHRNLAPEAADYFADRFPIAPGDRRFLAERYVFPIIEKSPG